MIITINTKDGHSFTFDSDTELISRDGVIVSSDDYEPVYIRAGKKEESIPPIFSGILSKKDKKIITPTGRINDIINDPNEIKI